LQQHIMGRPAKHSLPLLREHFQLDESIEEIGHECARLFHAILGDRPAPLRPGVVALLDYLAAGAIPHAIATSSSRGFVDHVFGPHKLLDRFRCILTAEDVTQGKPNPEIYLKAARRLEQEPAGVLVLEDSVSGVKAGLAAGAKVIAIPHEFSPLDQLAIAHAILPRLDDPALLGLFPS
jgi:HAD superfamily hydrolase (TIGR01509 family)